MFAGAFTPRSPSSAILAFAAAIVAERVYVVKRRGARHDRGGAAMKRAERDRTTARRGEMSGDPHHGPTRGRRMVGRGEAGDSGSDGEREGVSSLVDASHAFSLATVSRVAHDSLASSLVSDIAVVYMASSGNARNAA